MRAVGALVTFVTFLSAPSVERTGRATTAQSLPDKAATVLSDARAALGGETRIAAVKTFIAVGRTRQIRGDNVVPIEFEIQAELPDKYARRDEFPTQDNGPATIGFNGETLVQSPSPPPPRGATTVTPEQQAAAARTRMARVKHDFARLTLGMFASSFTGFPLTFTYLAQAEAPQGKADVIDVTGPEGFRARLFISNDSHLPLMLTWQAPAPVRPGGPSAAGQPPSPQPVEQRMYFADYREVEGLKLPFRIRSGVGSETTEETIFDKFRINARVDSRRFQSGS